MKKIFFLIFLLLVFVLGGIVKSAEVTTTPGQVEIEWKTTSVSVCPPGILGIGGPCDYPSISSIIATTTALIESIAPQFLVLLLIIGGFIYLLSPFDIKNIELGHRYIRWAIYGYIILLLITLIFTFISVIFGGPSPK